MRYEIKYIPMNQRTRIVDNESDELTGLDLEDVCDELNNYRAEVEYLKIKRDVLKAQNAELLEALKTVKGMALQHAGGGVNMNQINIHTVCDQAIAKHEGEGNER